MMLQINVVLVGTMELIILWNIILYNTAASKRWESHAKISANCSFNLRIKDVSRIICYYLLRLIF